MEHTCAFAVCTETINSCAICVFDFPCTNSFKTSFSLSVNFVFDSPEELTPAISVFSGLGKNLRARCAMFESSQQAPFATFLITFDNVTGSMSFKQ